ncbi:MAG: ABC transporter ATP-binding protein, partial [Mycobacteriales bacterium]
MQTATTTPLLELRNVSKTFQRPESRAFYTVLENINLTIRPNEIVALLGRSGSGKSTLLRIVAGLIQPTHGAALTGGKPIHGPNADVAMVFQSFALLPWQTVLENIEIGLEAQGLEHAERRRRSVEAVKMVGLEGFDRAYPKELSGGMQ